MGILKQNQVRLENDEEDIITRKNPNSTSVIYLATEKLVQYIIFSDKRSQSGVVPDPDGTIYLLDIIGTHYWGSN